MRLDCFTLGESAREAKLRTLFEFLGVDLWDERRGLLGGLGAGTGLVGDRFGVGRLGCESALNRGRLI